MFSDDSELTDLVNLEDWQGIQRSLSEVLNINVNTFSPDGTMLSKTSAHNRLCAEILPKIRAKENIDSCVKFLFESHVKNIDSIREKTNLKGPFGIEVFIVPIRTVGTNIIAYLALGPVILNKRMTPAEYAQEAPKFGLDPVELQDALIEINIFSYSKIDAIIKLVEDVFSHIAKTAYHKRRLAEIAPEIAEVDPIFARYYEEKLLNSLLNCCTLALNADSGSVMTMDQKTHMLHIKVASKLDKEIVDGAGVKVGEGIAGIAAATAKPIILPKDKDRNGLSGMMKRQYITSSMVVPFPKKNEAEVYGVINLNIIRKEREFSERDISLVKEMVNMASIALTPLTEAS
ncbi:MAG: PocR ligand-binding domain-containing protein [Candidatus Omnitrophota bacterium]